MHFLNHFAAPAQYGANYINGVPLGSSIGIGRWPGGLCANYADATYDIGTVVAPGGQVNGVTLIDGGKKQFVYDISLTTGLNRLKNGKIGPNLNQVSDGLSNTICITEDVGRVEQFPTLSYTDPIGNAGNTLPPTQVSGGVAYRAAWRWAEPDSSNGVSGPWGKTGSPCPAVGLPGAKVINNYGQSPIGGGATCPWTVTNCGPNDEAFSFHNAGCNVLFMDGSVKFIRDDIDVGTFFRLTSPIDGQATAYVE